MPFRPAPNAFDPRGADFQKRVKKGLEELDASRRDPSPKIVDAHNPVNVAKGDAARLGHDMSWYDGIATVYGACRKCQAEAMIQRKAQFGKAQVKGDAVVLWCR